MYEFALLAAIAALACGLLVPVVKPIAIRLGAVDTPGGRRLHSHEVPRLGGVAIFAAFLITLAVAWCRRRRT
jgi:UDP-GlcNAc:undecaprenyl-phosphate/decaprenyl-phosphate GlcNAc-1-phosphate transferase